MERCGERPWQSVARLRGPHYRLDDCGGVLLQLLRPDARSQTAEDRACVVFLSWRGGSQGQRFVFMGLDPGGTMAVLDEFRRTPGSALDHLLLHDVRGDGARSAHDCLVRRAVD